MPVTRRRLLLAVTVLLVASLPVSLYATHSWGNYHWARTGNPFTLKVGNNVSSNWTAQLNTSVIDWSASNTLDLMKVPGTSNKRCAAVAGTIQVCNGTYGNNGWLGLAQIWLSGGHISQGVAKMNDTYFNLAKYNNPNEKLHVMCQEVGHTFGLGHTSEDGSSQNTCMDYFSNTGANATSTLSTHPNQHDYDMLRDIYAHLDSSTTVSATKTLPNGMTAPDFSQQESWGRLVSRSANGKSETYELDFGGGNKILTHVFWSDEAARGERHDHDE